ncbi:MAG: L-threonylcarbamoyladenylate synthase [Planctomycetota bacterium]
MTKTTIADAAHTLREGGLVAFPTETVYGLGAHALDALAVAQIFEIKGRPRFDPLIVHIAHVDQLAKLTATVPPLARKLMDYFWPGPLSLVLPKHPQIPEIVTAGLPSVAVRCPAHETAQALLRQARVPVAAPSANRFGEVSPTTAAHVREQFGDRVPIVLDAGPCTIGLESTVISCVDPEQRPQLLRPGGTTLEEIEAVIGPVQSVTQTPVQPTSPGQLSRHYATRTPLIIAQPSIAATLRQLDRIACPRLGLLSFEPPARIDDFAAVEVLSADGDLREAGVQLFAAMRRLDQADLNAIIATPVPELGMGRAIMDRLRRAAAR